MTPPASQAQVFVVYFDFDKSVLTSQATSIIRQAADAYKRTGAVTIKIDGYTDLAGQPREIQGTEIFGFDPGFSLGGGMEWRRPGALAGELGVNLWIAPGRTRPAVVLMPVRAAISACKSATNCATGRAPRSPLPW